MEGHSGCLNTGVSRWKWETWHLWGWQWSSAVQWLRNVLTQSSSVTDIASVGSEKCHLTLSTPTRPLSIMSTSRPGVATSKWQPRASSRICPPMSAPPYTTHGRMCERYANCTRARHTVQQSAEAGHQDYTACSVAFLQQVPHWPTTGDQCFMATIQINPC